ncbi:hypothetical protein B0H11DRAFT_243533 [Mycena galericulata]|nr:hypothetical protein B0H11DRAFT_243533 [Mycena galericulata]
MRADPQQTASFRNVQCVFLLFLNSRVNGDVKQHYAYDTTALVVLRLPCICRTWRTTTRPLPECWQRDCKIAQEFTEYEGQMWTVSTRFGSGVHHLCTYRRERAIGVLVVSTPQSKETVDTTGGDPGGTAVSTLVVRRRPPPEYLPRCQTVRSRGPPCDRTQGIVVNDAGSPHDRIFAGENEDAPSERLREPIFAIIVKLTNLDGTATLTGFAGGPTKGPTTAPPTIGRKAFVVKDAGSPHGRILAGENEDAPSERLRKPIFAIMRQFWGGVRLCTPNDPRPPPGSSGGWHWRTSLV